MSDLAHKLRAELDQAEEKAWDSLSRYKFQMFGYWAAIWVHLNRLGGFNRPNPWKGLVHAARTHHHSIIETLNAMPLKELDDLGIDVSEMQS